MKKLIVLLVLSNGFFAFGQEVNKEFTKLLLNDQFDLADKNWNSTFNADNLFIAQNGYFELFRRSKKSGYYLFPKESKEFSAFKLEASIIFADYNNKRQSAGLLMMANSETGGGISVEINQKREYRIVRVYKDKQIPLNGNGWTKASHAITKGENVISIKTYDKVYDLFINGTFIQSFTDIELNRGKIGIYVGPDSKVKFDYLKVHGEEKTELIDLDVNNAKGEEQAFTQIILKLKDQINKKDVEIDAYKTKLKLCESKSQISGTTNSNDTGLINAKLRCSASLAVLEDEYDDLQMRLINREEQIKELKKFKSGVESGDDGDIIINLTNMVSNQKTNIEKLEKDNKSLNSENNSLFLETKELTKQLDRNTNLLTEEQMKNELLTHAVDSISLKYTFLIDSLQNGGVKSSPRDPNSILPEKELTEEQKLQKMIEKEREERRRRKEQEEQDRIKNEEDSNRDSN
jgi:regulator of replication initiation timing